MTETARIVFDKYEIRKNKKQKSAFRDFVKSRADELGYEMKVEKGSFGAKNIIVGDPENAKVIYTAHYDTCAALPFPNFITPKKVSIYILYQIALTLALFAIFFAIGFTVGMALGLVVGLLNVPEDIAMIISDFLGIIIYWVILLLLFAGPANKHTANDNTSGVTTLLDIMEKLPESQREKVAFVFFDLEESGLIGSASFAKKHKDIKKNKLLINFDCVSDGDNFLFVVPKKQGELVPLLEEAYKSDKFNVEVLNKGAFYPSDQRHFEKGVGVASLKKSEKFGWLYMNRIHTKRDVIYQWENVEFLVNASIGLASNL